MIPDNISHLLAKAAEGDLAPHEARQLLEAVRRDPSLLDELVGHISTERLIRAIESDPDGSVAAREIALRLEQERLAQSSSREFSDVVAQRARRSQWTLRLAGAAALVSLLGIAWWGAHELSRSGEIHSADGAPSSRSNPSSPSVAMVKSLGGAKGNVSGRPLSEGELLGPGTIRVESGTLLVVFLSGTRVLVAGPAELELVDESNAILRSGRLSAHVPPQAVGFSIATPGATVTDLGTSFGLLAGPGDNTEAHVFDGLVSFAPSSPSSEARQIPAGRALRLANGDISEFAASPADFPSGQEMRRRQADEQASRIQLWRETQEKLRQDPDVILSYTFQEEPTWDGFVPNQSKGVGSDGTVVGAGWSAGRWPGKHALEFRSLGDRLRFKIPGAHQTLTLVAWVRVDSLPNPFNALLMPVRYQPGSFHWNLDQAGGLRAAMRNTPSQRNGADVWDGPVTAKAMNEMDFGRWLCLATTYDSNSGSIVHYRDGQEIGRGEFASRIPAILSEMEFGNWGARPVNPDTQWMRHQPAELNLRNFVGRLDELLVLGRTLDPTEMLRLYQDGKP